MEIKHPYLMFLGDAPDDLAAKVADGVAKWRPDWCLGQYRLPGCKADLGLPDMTLQEAWDAGARTIIVGVANRGGIIPANWAESLVEGVGIGFDVASGLHNRLGSIDSIAAAAARHGAQLFDVRHPTQEFSIGKGSKRPGKRVLPVGMDCSIGKMFTALALEKEMLARNMKASFRATGQTGIFIAGSGVSVDAVVSDFISGATEWLCPANDEDHWDVVEGQGSLFHASFAGVTLGLIHGAQPDALVMCHEPTRTHMRGLPDFPLPEINHCIRVNEEMAKLTNPAARVIGVSVNTSKLPEDRRQDCLDAIEKQTGLPTVDAFAQGADRLVDALPA